MLTINNDNFGNTLQPTGFGTRPLDSMELLTLKELLWTLEGKKQALLHVGTTPEWLRTLDQIKVIERILANANVAA